MVARNDLPDRTSVSAGVTAMLSRGDAARAGSARRYTRFCLGWMLDENVPSDLSASLATAVVHGRPGPSCTSREIRWCGRGQTRPVIGNRVPATDRAGALSPAPTIRK